MLVLHSPVEGFVAFTVQDPGRGIVVTTIEVASVINWKGRTGDLPSLHHGYSCNWNAHNRSFNKRLGRKEIDLWCMQNIKHWRGSSWHLNTFINVSCVHKKVVGFCQWNNVGNVTAMSNLCRCRCPGLCLICQLSAPLTFFYSILVLVVINQPQYPCFFLEMFTKSSYN